jgi:hypothetical protein
MLSPGDCVPLLDPTRSSRRLQHLPALDIIMHRGRETPAESANGSIAERIHSDAAGGPGDALGLTTLTPSGYGRNTARVARRPQKRLGPNLATQPPRLVRPERTLGGAERRAQPDIRGPPSRPAV